MKQGLCYVCEQKGEHIGCYVIIQTRPETIEIVNVAVKEALHGNGFGKALVQHAIERRNKLVIKRSKSEHLTRGYTK